MRPFRSALIVLAAALGVVGCVTPSERPVEAVAQLEAVGDTPPKYPVQPDSPPAVVLDLVRLPRVFVRLIDGDGEPISRSGVIWYVDGHGQYLGATDVEGWAQAAPQLDGLSPGLRRFRVRIRGYAQLEFEETVPESGELRVERRLASAR